MLTLLIIGASFVGVAFLVGALGRTLFPPHLSPTIDNHPGAASGVTATATSTAVGLAKRLNEGQQDNAGAIFVLEGNGKCLLVHGGVVNIVKKGTLFVAQREKALPIRNISSVEVKKPGLCVGFIQFSIAGGTARDSSYTLTGGAFDAVADENSVIFSGEENYQLAIEIRNYIEGYARSSDAGSGLAYSAADEIRKLKSLLDDGILTSEEFASKKKRLLAT